MGLIKTIKVLNAGYNVDAQNPSGVWPGVKYSKDDLAGNNKAYTLEDCVLPQSIRLEFPDNSVINLIVGPNGIGKTTVLKTIARSATNARYFAENGRTKMFGGNFGADWSKIVPKTGGLFEARCERKFEHYGDTVTNFWSQAKEPDSSKVSYDEQMFHFYLSHTSFFMPDILRIYQQREEAVIEARLRKHLHRSLTGEFNPEKHVFPEKFQTFISNHTKYLGISEREIKERILYVMEVGGLALQTDCPTNVFGEYDFGSSFSRSDIHVGFFDVELQEQSRSKGEYTRKTLERLLNIERPRLLLLDEPTSHLGEESEKWFYNSFLGSIKDDSETMVFIATNDRVLGAYKGATVIDMNNKPTTIRINS